MTKREFNKANKTNYGERMPGDTRATYRADMLRSLGGVDRLTARARNMAGLRAGRTRAEGLLPTLGIGSPYRAGACLRFLGRMPRLPEALRDRMDRAHGY